MVPAVAGALVLGAGEVAAVVPHGLDRRTVALVFDFLTGGPAPAAAIPVALAKGLAMTTFARKLMLGAVTGALGLVGLGAVLADGGPPAPAPAALPAPAHAPIAPPVVTSAQSVFDWAGDEGAAKKILDPLKRDPKTEPSVLIQATCVRVPVGFCDQIGLVNERTQGVICDAHVLTQRETRMFTSLLRAESGCEVTSRSQMQVKNGKTGSASVHQKLDVVTEIRAVTEGQNKTYTMKTIPVAAGFKMEVTPMITSNGFVHLEIKTLFTDVAGGTVTVGKEQTAVINEQSIKSSAIVPDSGTLVVRTVSRETGPQKVVTTGGGLVFPLTEIRERPVYELLWVLTTHVIRAPEKGKELQPAPVPAAPIAPVTQPRPPVELPPRQ
ncbi:type ii and iii secretion system protein : : Secretin [Gemmata massiliana]|uniref:Type ii and iii secretion system protein:: Secretin n=1 Tax=Gemmata massiliana TaxID=1210884 RepID=A0A6P2D642_9BACT|nr:type ii and iii secretion system protein : : Secretin [Gemmata massiliana]